MLFSKTSAFALAMGLASYADAHMRMAQPVPFDSQNVLNGPLDPTGIDFPCKGDKDYLRKTENTWPIGSNQTLATIGQAVHGGGSCQISVTYDEKPNANSVWKVIHSIQGNCPARNQAGNEGSDAFAANPDKYEFQIPNDLKAGKAIAAWTWFNKVGNPEMYMNCAPITITGGNSKRDPALVARDYDSLPNMFKANISPSCKTTQTGFCVVFPNPGKSVEQDAVTPCKFGTPADTFAGDCIAFNGGSSGSGPAPNAPAPNPPVPNAPATSSTSAASAPSTPPGVFVEPPQGNPQPAPQGNSAGTCTTATFGKVICSADGKLIGICDYGGKVVMGPVAGGTKCVNGAMVAARDATPHIRGRRHRRFI
ncbi:MAG: hypothetical protein M1839_003924 [Geoglossum umbratile]|nr:MAG: hypothetical protein M1839_003924 [Geoglossum umbratile]